MKISWNGVNAPAVGAAKNAKAENEAAAASQKTHRNNETSRVSFDQDRLQRLTQAASQAPQVREEKVEALKRVIAGGSYHPAGEQIADAMISDVLPRMA